MMNSLQKAEEIICKAKDIQYDKIHRLELNNLQRVFSIPYSWSNGMLQ